MATGGGPSAFGPGYGLHAIHTSTADRGARRGGWGPGGSGRVTMGGSMVEVHPDWPQLERRKETV